MSKNKVISEANKAIKKVHNDMVKSVNSNDSDEIKSELGQKEAAAIKKVVNKIAKPQITGGNGKTTFKSGNTTVEIDYCDFFRDLDNYEILLNQALENAINEIVLLIEAEAKALAPADFGQLRASIESEVIDNWDNIVGYVSANTEYALFVHEGTGIYAKGGGGRKTPWSYIDKNGNRVVTNGQKPKEFLALAVEKHKDKIRNIIQKHLGK